MKFPPAPFYSDLSEGPANARGWWATTSDGLRVRVAHYPSDGARGTVLLFPGRTEYVEKYGRTAADLAAAGYHTLCIDWRGQGLADRMLDDSRTGHVDVFADYQKDIKAMLELADWLEVPGPRHLIAHSMGGCIGLRALMEGLDVASAVFTGPMWGIRLAQPVRPAAWALSRLSKTVGLSHLYAPGTKPVAYVVSEPFEGNTLTTDADMFDYMRRQVVAIPELQLGGPSLHWLHEALSETRELARCKSPDVPCICFTGTNERIVDVDRIRDRMARWPHGHLEMVPEGEHEILMEDPATRARVTAQMIDLFQGAGQAQALSA
ncbi:alpha/beta fold hydrolase [Tropicibacter naphthalenivorans]|uniref:Lysophospholipase L2 n=1 Tax=Tropicibacter naphthalenivorans TaxID=441103 RepID=A0A0P1G313_9RHOB|nr:alpha/beta hydrolase [Tropicibacter naphthalenivorans]CUH76218.1 lysophospholipase L2 [Tropicibacter naphthalenivorans]SMC39358.1 lysophospholipase [Tropicibacter naphthalenivorans]